MLYDFNYLETWTACSCSAFSLCRLVTLRAPALPQELKLHLRRDLGLSQLDSGDLSFCSIKL